MNALSERVEKENPFVASFYSVSMIKGARTSKHVYKRTRFPEGGSYFPRSGYVVNNAKLGISCVLGRCFKADRNDPPYLRTLCNVQNSDRGLYRRSLSNDALLLKVPVAPRPQCH
jgi:hypothetical protein